MYDHDYTDYTSIPLNYLIIHNQYNQYNLYTHKHI